MGKYCDRMERSGRWTLMNLILLAPIGLAQTQPSPTNGTIDAVMPAYTPFCYEEDWSFMKDRANSGDWLDHLKYVRVSDSTYVSLGGETRSRYEVYTYSHFEAGEFMRETPPGESTNYATTWILF